MANSRRTPILDTKRAHFPTTASPLSQTPLSQTRLGSSSHSCFGGNGIPYNDTTNFLTVAGGRGLMMSVTRCVALPVPFLTGKYKWDMECWRSSAWSMHTWDLVKVAFSCYYGAGMVPCFFLSPHAALAATAILGGCLLALLFSWNVYAEE